MNNTLSINFTFNESQVRTLSDGEVVWFVAKDVATILGHANPERAIRKYVDEEDRRVTNSVTLEGERMVNREMTFITEYGVYSLILASHTEEAKSSNIGSRMRCFPLFANRASIPFFPIRSLSTFL